MAGGILPTLDIPFVPTIQVTLAADDSSIDQVENWSPITVGDPVCNDWFVYQTNVNGHWRIALLNEAAEMEDDVTEISALEEDIFDNIAPSRSPDGEWVALASNRDGNWEIYLSNLDSSDVRRLTFNTLAAETAPIWVPEGTMIYQSSRDGNWNLYSFDLVTGGHTILTGGSGSEMNASASPDGQHVVYQSDESGLWQIYTLDLATQAVTLLSDGTGNDFEPRYTADGARIVFRSVREGVVSGIYLMDADGSEPLLISDTTGEASTAGSSEDVKYIAYQSKVDGDWDIYVYELDTGNTRHLTDGGGSDYLPQWDCDEPVSFFTDSMMDVFGVPVLPIDAPPVTGESMSELRDNPADDD